jgi:hypothetical protein
MRPIRPDTRSCARAALGLTLAACLLAVTFPARAGDDNSDDAPIDTRILRGIMHGLGLKDGSEAAIKYEERPPLVIPPDLKLPPPQKTDTAVQNPAWPKDPDVEAAKRERQKRKQLSAGESSDAFITAARPLSPDQLAPNAATAPRQHESADATNVSINQDGNMVLPPSQLGSKSSLWDKMFGNNDEGHAAKFTGEPPRVSLTEPPPGYQTPSPDQPYGSTKAPAPKATNYYTEHVTAGNDANK